MRLSAALIVVVCVTAPAVAQVQQATLEGTVVDSAGGSTPGATIALQDVSTSAVRSVVTDASGAFRLSNLPPGTYDLQVELLGFATYAQRGLLLAVGQTARIHAILQPAAVHEAVVVTAQPPALESSRTGTATVVDTERIEELPVRSRNALEFVLLAPGVMRAEPAIQPGGASVVPGSGFSFAGLRPRSNIVTIDGLDNNDAYSGGSRTELSPEIVREFQVVTTGWSAESGGAAGAAVNVVTKSGTNTLHGDAFLFAQSGRLNARPRFEETFGSRPELTRYRAGAALGGPLRKDRTFYYAAFERERTDRETASDLDAATLERINTALAGEAFRRSGVRRLTQGLFPVVFTESELSGKLRHQISSRQSVTVGVAATTTRDTADAFNTGGLTDLSGRGTAKTADRPLTATWTAIVGNRATNELRAQGARREVDLRTADSQGPSMLIPGTAEFGRPYAGNDDHQHTYLEIGDTFARTSGHHFLKIGFEVAHAAVQGTLTNGVGGMFVFPTIDAFTNHQPTSFRQVFADPRVELGTTRTGIFLQDRWTPHRTLTLDVGVRADAEALRPTFGVTSRQVTPRMGVAWTPAPKWVLRGGAGFFADRLALAGVERALTVDGVRGYEQVVDGDAAVSLLASGEGGALTAPLGQVAPSIYTVQPGRWASSSRQVGAGIERELTSDLTLAMNYLFVRGQHLARTVNVNLRPAQTGQTVFDPERRDPVFGDIFELQPTASSTYHGLTMALNRRFAHEIEWSAAYTWSRTTDTASDFDEQPQNPYDLAAEEGRSRYDQRHRFVVSALFELGDADDRQPGTNPGAWARTFGQIEVAPILTITSGSAFNPLTGGDDNLSHAFPFVTRPTGLDRNSLRSPATATLDLRVLKYFIVKPHGKLDLVLEAFNVLNRLNVTQLNSVYGPYPQPLAGFGRAIEAGNARQLQLSIDFEF